MKISVVIPTLNRRESLKKVFEDLRLQTHKDFEVIVMDGGSGDGTDGLCKSYRKYLDIKFYIQKEPGIVTAMNEALQYCRGDVFTRTDDDVALSASWLAEVVSTFSRYPDAAGVTGPTVIPQERRDKRDLMSFNEGLAHPHSLFWSVFKAIYHGYFMEGEPFAVSRFFKSGAFSLGSNYAFSQELKDILAVDYLESCNWSVKLSLVRKIGGFDNRYGGVSEYFEADAVYRIKKMGYKMYFNPKACLQHLVDRGGNYKARSGTYSRAHNFILFYMQHIKPNNLDKFLRFSLYLVFINAYFTYCSLRQRQLSQLSGLAGTAVNFIRYFPKGFAKN